MGREEVLRLEAYLKEKLNPLNMTVLSEDLDA